MRIIIDYSHESHCQRFLVIKAKQAPPTFINEVTDTRIRETEEAKFECQYSGTPMPEIPVEEREQFEREQRVIEEEENLKMELKKKGDVLKKRVSIVEQAVIKKPEVKTETVKDIKKTTIKKEKAEKKIEIIESAVQVDSTPSLKKVPEKSEELPVGEQVKPSSDLPTQTSVSISEVTPQEQIVEFPDEQKPDESTAVVTQSTQESVTVSQVETETSVSKLKTKTTKKQQVKQKVVTKKSVQMKEAHVVHQTEDQVVIEEQPQETAQVSQSVVEPVEITQVQPIDSVEDIAEKKTKKKQAKERKTSRKESVHFDLTATQADEIEEILETLHVEEFGPGKKPLIELATVGVMLRHGITIEEVVSQYEAEQYPSLLTAPAQNAMVQLVEREGHSVLISEVLTQESTTEQTLVGVFKAFLRMVELKHATVEEVLPLFAPDDFQPLEWEQHVSEAIVEETGVTEQKTEITQVEVQEGREIEHGIDFCFPQMGFSSKSPQPASVYLFSN